MFHLWNVISTCTLYQTVEKKFLNYIMLYTTFLC